jgi:hypothetical protein
MEKDQKPECNQLSGQAWQGAHKMSVGKLIWKEVDVVKVLIGLEKEHGADERDASGWESLREQGLLSAHPFGTRTCPLSLYA